MSLLNRIRNRSRISRGRAKRRIGRATGNRRLRAEGLYIGFTATGPRQRDTIERAVQAGGFDTVQATWNLLEPSAGSALAAFPGADSIHPAVAFVSTSGKLVYDGYTPATNWTGPYPLPGAPRSDSQIAWNADGTSVYFIESDGRVAADSRSGSGWSGPAFTGGTAARGSALDYAQGTGSSASEPSLTFIDSDSALVEDSYAGGWHGPDPLPGA